MHVPEVDFEFSSIYWIWKNFVKSMIVKKFSYLGQFIQGLRTHGPKSKKVSGFTHAQLRAFALHSLRRPRTNMDHQGCKTEGLYFPVLRTDSRTTRLCLKICGKLTICCVFFWSYVYSLLSKTVFLWIPNRNFTIYGLKPTNVASIPNSIAISRGKTYIFGVFLTASMD